MRSAIKSPQDRDAAVPLTGLLLEPAAQKQNVVTKLIKLFATNEITGSFRFNYMSGLVTVAETEKVEPSCPLRRSLTA